MGYVIKHFCTDDSELFRVIYESPSVGEQCFHGTHSECEHYIEIMNSDEVPYCVKSFIRRYVSCERELRVALM